MMPPNCMSVPASSTPPKLAKALHPFHALVIGAAPVIEILLRPAALQAPGEILKGLLLPVAEQFMEIRIGFEERDTFADLELRDHLHAAIADAMLDHRLHDGLCHVPIE